MFEAVNRRSVSEEVFDQLRQRIITQQLKAGEELPSERLLSSMLGVSRNAIREAIKRLQQACLVEVKHGGTTVVLDYKTEAGAELLPSLLFNEKGEIQVDIARSIVRMRQVLSPEIAADAAAKNNPSLADRLDQILSQMHAQTAADVRQRLAFSFWDALVDGSGNMAYRLAFNSLRKTYEPILPLLTQILGHDIQKLDVFAELARCVRDGEPASAMKCARRYIDASSLAIYNFLDLYERQTAPTNEAPNGKQHRD